MLTSFPGLPSSIKESLGMRLRHVIKSTVVSIYYTGGNHDHQIKKLIP